MKLAALLALALVTVGCLHRQRLDPGVIVVAMPTSPNTFDPRVGTDDASQKTAQLIFNGLMKFDEHLRVVPDLAERLDRLDPTTYVATLRRGVLFHDGHELTSADVVFTFRSLLEPTFVSGLKGAYTALGSVDPVDRYTVVFHLKRPWESFPANLIIPQIVPAGAGPSLRTHPIGTGPYRFVSYAVDDRVVLAPFDRYFGGAPRNAGLVLKVIPDDIMRGLELRKGTTDIVVNDLTPDIAYQLRSDPRLQEVETPGVDYQYLGLNLRDPILRDVRVRQALAYAINRRAIVEYLRRGLATPASGLIPPISWAFAPDEFSFPYDPAKARALLDEAGYRDPDGDGPRTRLRLSLKISNSQEFNQLQASVIQQDLRAVGIELEIRTYEFATLYTDILNGNFQMYSLQWTGGSMADPDILRRVFDSKQVPPSGFNRGYFVDPQVDALLDKASASSDPAERLELFRQVQHIVAVDVPYISLWNKTNVAVAQRSLANVRLTPLADLRFLKDVARVGAPAPATN